ncbi:MAG: DUF882 domain-containing protein [Alphaproteobacteria bacterium]|jgi:uncharacterized protein YcbK (DUF882 family)|nr:DUF882 domain-containing protein [Alphaproteobacteria bacterium]
MTLARRDFLTYSLTTAAALTALPRSGLAIPSTRRQLSLYDPRSLASLDVEYWVDGWYNPDGLARISYFMRDSRNDHVIDMDPGLVDILYALWQRTGASDPLHIISGYRSPQTNAHLAATRRGVARNSYHMYGRAADVTLPHYSIYGLREAALSLQAGGVGYYPRAEFVHVDNGPVRDW